MIGALNLCFAAQGPSLASQPPIIEPQRDGMAGDERNSRYAYSGGQRRPVVVITANSPMDDDA